MLILNDDKNIMSTPTNHSLMGNPYLKMSNMPT